MNEDTLARLCRLAPALKHSAHLLLHHHHNLSLDTHTLLDMQEAFSLILEMEQHTNFHVLPPNHRQHPAIPHLQMLYDLLQKVAGLKLWGRQDRQQATVSLRCFRSLRTLELAGVTVASLRALQALRSQLKRLVVTRGLSCLADLFVRCGADQAGEFVWEQLVEATLSHNALQDGRLDDSLRLLPNLKVLDISHCGLHDVACLRLLPSLCYLDVSHNDLTDLPQLTPASSPGLVVLLASHNSIHSLHGLQALTGLEEVNIAYNFIATRAGLVTLAALPRLRSLCIEGNPVCCDPGHCSAVLCLLHPATLPSQFLLDGHSLTPTEQDLIGSVSSPPELLHTPSPSSPVADPPRQHQEAARDTHPPPSLPDDSLKQAVTAPRRRSRKKKTTRHIALGGEEEEEEEEEGGESGPPSLSHPSPYLYIPPTPPTSMLQDNIPAPPPPSLVLGGPLSSNHGTLSEALAALAPPPPVRPNQDEEHSDKLLEEILQAKPSQSSSIPPPATTAAADDGGGEKEEEEEEEEVEVVEEEEEVEGFYRKVEDLQVGCSSDEEEEEEGALLILAQRLKEEEEEEEEEEEMRSGGGGERERASDVILSLTSTHFKEKHFVSTKTLFRWDLRCIQTLEEQQQQQQQQQSTIKMAFDTTRPSHKSRIYTMETEDCLNLQAALTPLPRMSASCSSCKNMRSSRGSQDECKDCGRQKAPLQLTSTPLPPLQPPPSTLCEDNSGDDGGGGGGGGGGDSAPNHYSDRPQHTQEPHHMQESSSSGSLTGSVCTAYERGGPGGAGGCSSLPVTPFKSNPSVQPSALDATDVTDCSSTLYLSAESNLGDHTSTTPLFADTLAKEEEEEEGGGRGGEEEEEGGLVSIAPWVESLLHTHTGYHWLWWEDIAKEETLKKKEEEEEEESNSSSSSNSTLMKPNNPITYNYEDLSQVDHRLKLYLEVYLLQQTDEQLLGVVKAVMVLSSKKREFRGLLVLSSVMFYLLEVTGPEDDTPQSWLEEVGRGPLAEIEEVHSLFQRQGVALSLSLSTATATLPTLLLVCLADSHRSNCFFNFLMEALGGQGLAPSLAEAAPTQEEALLALLGEEQGETGPPSLLSIVSLLTDGGCSESQYLIITDSDLVLYLADLTWYLPTTTTTTATTTATTGGGLVTTAAQKIHNVTSVEVHTPHHLSIHFLDEVTQKESLWRVHVASPQAGWQLIEALRAPWSDLFSVQLQVTHHTHHE